MTSVLTLSRLLSAGRRVVHRIRPPAGLAGGAGFDRRTDDGRAGHHEAPFRAALLALPWPKEYGGLAPRRWSSSCSTSRWPTTACLA